MKRPISPITSLELFHGHQDDGVLTAADPLRALGEREIHDFDESVLGVGEVPFHSVPPEKLDCLALLSHGFERHASRGFGAKNSVPLPVL